MIALFNAVTIDKESRKKALALFLLKLIYMKITSC